MLRIGVLLVSLLLVAASTASAATPADGRFSGPTSQTTKPPTMAFDIARDGRVFRALRFPSVANCGGKAKLRIATSVRGPVRLVVGPQIKLRGGLSGSLGKGSTYRARFRMSGRFPTANSARGVWGLYAVVRSRNGRVTARCRTGTVSWRAKRL